MGGYFVAAGWLLAGYWLAAGWLRLLPGYWLAAGWLHQYIDDPKTCFINTSMVIKKLMNCTIYATKNKNNKKQIKEQHI